VGAQTQIWRIFWPASPVSSFGIRQPIRYFAFPRPSSSDQVLPDLKHLCCFHIIFRELGHHRRVKRIAMPSPKNSDDENSAYDWTAGQMSGIIHKRLVASGGSGEVHKVDSP